MAHDANARLQLGPSGMFKMFPVALLRLAVGWHFLYEGLTKLFDPSWTAAGYLQSTTGGLAGFYHWLASDPTILSVVDALNVWGLILIGACLMLGLFTRFSAGLGMVLLGLYPSWLRRTTISTRSSRRCGWPRAVASIRF